MESDVKRTEINAHWHVNSITDGRQNEANQGMVKTNNSILSPKTRMVKKILLSRKKLSSPVMNKLIH